MRKKRIVIGAVVVGVTSLFAAWLFGWFSGNPALAEVQQLQAKMADPSLKDADRQALVQQMRDKMQALSPDARRAAFENGQQMFEKRELEHIKQILAMSPADRNKGAGCGYRSDGEDAGAARCGKPKWRAGRCKRSERTGRAAWTWAAGEYD